MRKIEFAPIRRGVCKKRPILNWHPVEDGRWLSSDNCWYIIRQDHGRRTQGDSYGGSYIYMITEYVVFSVGDHYGDPAPRILGYFPTFQVAAMSVQNFLNSDGQFVERMLETMPTTTPTLRKQIFL